MVRELGCKGQHIWQRRDGLRVTIMLPTIKWKEKKDAWRATFCNIPAGDERGGVSSLEQVEMAAERGELPFDVLLLGFITPQGAYIYEHDFVYALQGLVPGSKKRNQLPSFNVALDGPAGETDDAVALASILADLEANDVPRIADLDFADERFTDALEKHPAASAYVGTPFSTSSREELEMAMVELAARLDQSRHPDSLFEPPRTFTKREKERMEIPSERHDWQRDKQRVVVKTASLSYVRSQRFWIAQWLDIKLAVGGARDPKDVPFDELQLVLRTPEGIYLIKHDKFFAVVDQGWNTPKVGHQVVLYGPKRQRHWQPALETMIDKIERSGARILAFIAWPAEALPALPAPSAEPSAALAPPLARRLQSASWTDTSWMDELRQRGNDWQELVVKTAIEEQGECGPDPWLLQLQMLGSKWVHMDEAMCEAMGGDGDAAVPEMIRDGPSKADPAKAVAETVEPAKAVAVASPAEPETAIAIEEDAAKWDGWVSKVREDLDGWWMSLPAATSTGLSSCAAFLGGALTQRFDLWLWIKRLGTNSMMDDYDRELRRPRPKKNRPYDEGVHFVSPCDVMVERAAESLPDLPEPPVGLNFQLPPIFPRPFPSPFWPLETSLAPGEHMRFVDGGALGAGGSLAALPVAAPGGAAAVPLPRSPSQQRTATESFDGDEHANAESGGARMGKDLGAAVAAGSVSAGLVLALFWGLAGRAERKREGTGRPALRRGISPQGGVMSA